MGRVSKIQGQIVLPLRRPSKQSITAVAFAFLLSGCASTFPTRDVTREEVAIAHPAAAINESELLGVRIKPFEPGEVKESKKASLGISQEIRKAEGYYSAVQLKKSMQQSGYWGPVRVVPAEVTGGEVVVTGRILESDGEFLKVQVNVQDATGANWLSKEYQATVDPQAYSQSNSNGTEAFQYLYNRIANDVAGARSVKDTKEITKIRQTEELKFASYFAPEAFAGYLKVDGSGSDINSLLTKARAFASKDSSSSQSGGPARILRLPAANDPMLVRVRRIQVREESYVDTLDLQHDELARKIGQPYTQWRMARVNEMNAIRELEEKRNSEMGKAAAIGALGILAGVLIAAAGGGYRSYSPATASAGASVTGAAVGAAVQLAMQAEKQTEEMTEIHKVALQELGESLATDLHATVIQTEGETIELRGTAEEKFKQWRGILGNIYQGEAGAPTPTDATQPKVGPATTADSKQ